MSKFYTLYFEGQVEVEADSDAEATDKLMNMITSENVGYYRICESDPNSLNELRLLEEY